MDAAGRVLARKRLPEGVAGMARLHELIGQQLGEDAEDAEVVIGIETDRGPWVAALVAAGYTVFAPWYSTEAAGTPVAISALPSDHAMTSDGLASTLEAGFEIGRIAGRLVAWHMASMTCCEKARWTPE